MSTYCHTCKRSFHPMGIARHRSAHRDRNQNCRITYTNGDTYDHNYAARICSVCSAEFDIDAEGGYEGLFGMIPFIFCVTCNAAIVDYVRITFPYEDDD